jgi:hypothetical protein
VDPDPELVELLTAGHQAGQAKIEELGKAGGDAAGGWTSAMHIFDYNLDHLGPGTIDAPEWKISEPPEGLCDPGRGRAGRAVGQPRL